MKTEPISAVVPAPLEAAQRPPSSAALAVPGVSPSEAQASVSSSDASLTSAASAGGGASTAQQAPGWSDVARVDAIRREGARGTASTSEAMASQRVALSRLRIEALMLEAQMAAAAGDAERARAVARAVRTEAGNIRQALRGSLEAGQGVLAASTAASTAVSRAQAAARDAASQESGDPTAMAPWRGAPSPRDSAAVEAAPAGTPTSNLHRSAYEALRRAQQVLDQLARMDWSRRVDSGIDDASRDLRAAAGAADAASLVNRLEVEDGALWGGYNGLA